MAINEIQFQKGLSLADFMKDYGSKLDSCKWAIAIFFILTLSACSGRGSSDQSSAPETANVQLRSTSVSIAETVPQQTRQSITEFDSMVGSAKIGEPLSVPFSNRGNDTLVLALDSQQKVRLAAMTASQNSVLSADSTAHALVRIRLGAVPDGKTVAQLNDAIKTSESYNLLVTTVDNMLGLGMSPMPAAATATVADDVISQALTKLAATSTTAAARVVGATTPTLLAISNNRAADLPTPYVVVGSKTAGVYLSEAGVSVINTLPLAWSAYTSPNPNDTVLLPAASIQSALGAATLGTRIKPTLFDNNNGKAYDFSVFQDSKSRNENSKALILDTMGFALNLLALDKVIDADCVSQVASSFYTPEGIEALGGTAPPTSEVGGGLPPNRLENYLSTVVKQGWPDVVKTCLKLVVTPTVALEYIIEEIVFIPGKIVTSYVGLAGKVAAIKIYSNSPKTTVGICEEPAAVPTGYVFVNCAVEFKVDPIVMAPGAETELSIKAFDKKGNPTALPKDLAITSPLNSGTVEIDVAANKISALKEGLIGLEIKDPETDAKGFVQVNVVEGTITPSSQRTTVGGSANFSIKGPAGSNYILPKGGVTIQSLQPSVADLNILLTASTPGSANFAVTGKSAGQATIQYSHPMWVSKPQATLFVDGVVNLGEEGFFSGLFKQTGCTSTTPVQFCPSVTHTGNSDLMAISFRTGNEPYNLRIDQDFGCISTAANINPAVGSTFGYSLSSEDPLTYPVTAIHTITLVAPDRIEGTLALSSSFPNANKPGETIAGTTNYTWVAYKVKPFPKCLPPTVKEYQGNRNFDFFCPKYGAEVNGFGCDFIPVGGRLRQGEWAQ
jgi:hypothetical protein